MSPMSNKVFITLLILNLPFQFAHSAEEISVDLALSKRCDEIYRPRHCIMAEQGPGLHSVTEKLYHDVGINTGVQTEEMPNFNPVTISIRENRSIIQPSTVSGTVNTQAPTPPQATQNTAPNEPGFNPPMGTQQAVNPGQENIQQSSYIPQNQGQITQVGGMVYSEEADSSPKLEPIKTTPATPSISRSQSPSPLQNAVSANKGFDNSDSEQETASPLSNTGPDSGDFQGYEAAVPGGFNASTNNGSDGFFSRMAKAFGGFMGVAEFSSTGANNTAHSASKRTGQKRKGSNSSKVKGSRNLALNKNLLKDKFGRYISSSHHLEFGSKSMEMWQNMCGHYAAYASRHRIPYDREGCKQAK